MIVATMPLTEIPGPRFRQVIRQSMRTGEPWSLIVDTRGDPPPSLHRLAGMLPVRRRARRRGGDVVLVVDNETRRRLAATGLDRWLPLAGSVSAARPIADRPAPARAVG